MRRHALDIHALRLLGVEFDERGGVVDLALGFLQRLALFEHHQPREILPGRQDEVVPVAQDAGALLRQPCGPGPEAGVGGINRGSGLGCRERGNAADPRTRRRIGHVDEGAVFRRDPRAVDIGIFPEQPGIFEDGEGSLFEGCKR